MHRHNVAHLGGRNAKGLKKAASEHERSSCNTLQRFTNCCKLLQIDANINCFAHLPAHNVLDHLGGDGSPRIHMAVVRVVATIGNHVQQFANVCSML